MVGPIGLSALIGGYLWRVPGVTTRVKFGCVTLVFLVLGAATLSIPVFIGRMPSLPSRGATPWTVPIDMRVNPVAFWNSERFLATLWATFFALFLLYLRLSAESRDESE
jgi:hypothetical protein